MALTQQEVEHIARLARLDLSGEEKERYRQQLSDILDYAARLQSLETGDITPTFSVLPGRSFFREDETRPGLTTGELLRNAPEVEAKQFRIPQVFD